MASSAFISPHRPRKKRPNRRDRIEDPRRAKVSPEEMADLCALLASDRAHSQSSFQLPMPGSPECDEVFIGAWAAFRHVTTQLGHQLLIAEGSTRHRLDPLEAFVRGRAGVSAHVRWAEAEAMIRAGEWSSGLCALQPTQRGGWRNG